MPYRRQVSLSIDGPTRPTAGDEAGLTRDGSSAGPQPIDLKWWNWRTEATTEEVIVTEDK
ncbi:MAG: hypothetical protein V1897_01375 [Pseudomonadota bacterium]